MPRGYKYKTDEERQKAKVENWKRFSYKPWTCDKCKVTILRGNKTNHLNSKKHNLIV